jgi:hypothetical protein
MNVLTTYHVTSCVNFTCKVIVQPKPNMGSLSYKICNNKMPTLNPKLENEKKKTTKKKNTKINLGFWSKFSFKGV